MPPKTPLQRGQFIDACIQCITSDEDDEYHGMGDGDMMGMRSCVDMPTGVNSVSRLVYTRSQLSSHANGSCSFCGAKSTHLAMANPYTHRCYILLCDTCVG